MLSKFTLREKLLLALSWVLLVIVLFTGRELPEVIAKDQPEDDLYKDLKIFSDVLAIVRQEYFREVKGEEVVKGAIKGMLATLDPHSGYLDPDFYKDLKVQTKGEFGGLGIEITIRDGLLVVVTPMEGTPAEKAGIQPGDTIVKIEGKFTKEFSLVDAVKKLRGPKGTPINISIHRQGYSKLLDVTIIRDSITVKSVRKRYLGEGFGYIRVSQFMEKTSDDLKDALAEIKKKADNRLRGLILDLRNNPGGLLTQAIRVSDMFLEEGVIVYTMGRKDSQKQKFFAHARGTEKDFPMIVLVNGGSASASEIVAGALKDHGRALVLGTQTFGKGSVQTITPLENGGAVTLTTALYYTKSEHSLQGEGVKPDIEIENRPLVLQEDEDQDGSEALRVREKDLPGAINNPDKQGKTPLEKLNRVPTISKEFKRLDLETVDLKEWMKRDAQFERAFDLLKTFDIFKDEKPVTAINTVENEKLALKKP